MRDAVYEIIVRFKTTAVLVSLLLFVSSGNAYAGYADASAIKQLMDSYFEHHQDNNSVVTLIKKSQIVRALYEDYDKAAYKEALTYLQSFTTDQPDATIALADAIQSHWDSNYLQSYLRSYASDYGRLKFLSALSMGVGGIGLLKNPFLHHALLISNMHVLLPLAGGTSAYYLLTLYDKSKTKDIPADPQTILQLTSGSNYYSYEDKRNDYLRRLLGVGGGLAGGKLIYQVLAGHFTTSTSGGTLFVANNLSLPPPDPNKEYKKLTLSKTANSKGKSLQRYKSMFRRPFRKTDFAVIIGALLSYYAIEKSTYFALHNMTVIHTQAQLKKAIYKLRSAVNNRNDAEIISAARQVSDLTIQLVTVKEIKHLHSIASYEIELLKPANELAQIGSEVTNKIIELSEKLPILQKKSSDPDDQAAGKTATEEANQAMQNVIAGKLASGIALFSQVGQMYAVLAREVPYLRYYRDRMLAKYTHLVSMYQNIAKIKKQSINWQNKFSPEELQAAVSMYLKYYHTDADKTATELPQHGQQQKIATSTRAFARFLGEYIANSDTKTYNTVILHVLSLYELAPQHRPALATLVKDIDDLADLQGKSFLISSIEGGAIGAGVLLAARMLGGLAAEFGMLENAPKARSYLNIRSVKTLFKHLGYAVAAGAAVGVAWHLLKMIAKKKLPAQNSLFEVQKTIVYNMSFNACVLLHDVKSSDNLFYEQMTAAEIQTERKKIADQVKKLNTLVTQVNHLSTASPQLRVAQPIKNVNLSSTHKECSSDSARSASVTPVADDLNTVKSIVSLRLRKLNAIEKRRAKSESETKSESEES